MDFDVEKTGDVAVVLLPGETLEASNVNDFRGKMEPILEENAKVVFDMRQVRFIDSMGCGLFLSFLKRLQKIRGRAQDMLHNISCREPLHTHGFSQTVRHIRDQRGGGERL